MPDCYAMNESFLREYLFKINSATPEQIQFAQSSIEIKEPSVLEIDGNTAFINVRGVLTAKPSFLGALFGYTFTTYQALLDAIDLIKEKPEISKVALIVDSPGGVVNPGVDDTWKALFELSKSKELIAVNTGVMTSGAYWIASAAPKIVSVSELTEQGSIGVYASYYDWTEYDKKLGIKEVIIVSKNAPLKHLAENDDRLVKQIQERIDSVEDVFLSRIAEGQGLEKSYIAENFGQGAVLTNEKALKVGMIDKVTTIDKVFAASSNGTSAVLTTQVENEEKDKQMPSLKELLAEHPEANAEVEGRESAAFERGKKTAQEESSNNAAFAAQILRSSEYSEQVKNIAADVVTGKASLDVLKAVVGYEDQRNAAANSQNAQEDEGNQVETPAIKPKVQTKTEGVISDEEDVEAEIQRLKRL